MVDTLRRVAVAKAFPAAIYEALTAIELLAG